VSFNREICVPHREKGYSPADAHTDQQEKESDHTIIFRALDGLPAVKKPNAIEITRANSIIACK